mgnify:CR=1 FL=1
MSKGKAANLILAAFLLDFISYPETLYINQTERFCESKPAIINEVKSIPNISAIILGTSLSSQKSTSRNPVAFLYLFPI